jgi:hypothetical protein
MGRRSPEDPVLRLPVRLTPRQVLNVLIGAIGIGVVLALLAAAVVSAGSGTTGGLLTALGLLLTAALAAYLYLPDLLSFVRLAVTRRARLLLDEEGIVVAHGPPTALVESRLAWTDCAAVVTSPFPMRNGRVMNYVQFVPARPEAVAFNPGNAWILAKSATLGVPPETGAMTSVLHARFRDEITEVMAWVRAHNPDLRIVESLRGVSPSAQHLLDGDPGRGGAALGEAVERPEVAGGGEPGHEEAPEGGLEPG